MTTILAIGATGTVGRHLVPQLARRGLSVRALVRNPAAELPAGVDRVVGDLADPASYTPALDGVAAVYLACGNHPAQAAWENGVIDAAAAAGVRRIVKLSTSDARSAHRPRSPTRTPASRPTCGRAASTTSCSSPPSR
jgi:uncharacterized protein YbjT (DUF2867 family)